jgi:deoxyribonuclease V
VELEGSIVGAALRVRAGEDTRPLYVSPGHLCDVASAVELTLACAPRHRTPEPLRAARMVVAETAAAGSPVG